MKALRDFAKANGLAELQDVTLAARTRTKTNIGTQVRQGLFRVIRMEYGISKSSHVVHLSGWLLKDAAIQFIKDIK